MLKFQYLGSEMLQIMRFLGEFVNVGKICMCKRHGKSDNKKTLRNNKKSKKSLRAKMNILNIYPCGESKSASYLNLKSDYKLNIFCKMYEKRFGKVEHFVVGNETGVEKVASVLVHHP